MRGALARAGYGRYVMVRRPWLLAQLALVGVLALLALPSSSYALRAGIPIFLTANGPSPAVGTFPAGMYPIWINQDTVAHTVAFANGCSIQVAAGAVGQCGNGLWNVVGDYPYTVDGTTQASVDVTAESRAVSLTAKRHGIRRGSELMLHGRLAIAMLSPPVLEGPRQPVTVLARSDRYHAFHRIAVVIAKPHRLKNRATAYSVWHLRVRPRTQTTYIVEANSQPAIGQFWQQAWSSRFTVRVHR
jgi:hypothetical protein